MKDLAQQELVLPQFLPIRDIIYSCCNVAGFVPWEVGAATHPEGQRVLLDALPEKRAIIGLRDISDVWNEDYKMLPICDSFCEVSINLAWSQTNPLRPSAEAFRDYALRFYIEEYWDK